MAVLRQAIAEGGTTLNDFADGEGRSGYFQVSLSVYDREGEPCLRVRTARAADRPVQPQHLLLPRLPEMTRGRVESRPMRDDPGLPPLSTGGSGAGPARWWPPFRRSTSAGGRRRPSFSCGELVRHLVQSEGFWRRLNVEAVKGRAFDPFGLSGDGREQDGAPSGRRTWPRAGSEKLGATFAECLELWLPIQARTEEELAAHLPRSSSQSVEVDHPLLAHPFFRSGRRS